MRYLGCQIGIDLSAEQHIVPLLLSIQKKLLHWSSTRLSLAGRGKPGFACDDVVHHLPLLLQRIQQCSPATGGPWQPEIIWIFTEMRRVGLSRKPEDCFACCLLRTWEHLRPAAAAYLHRGVLATGADLERFALSVGPAHGLGEWLDFRRLPEEAPG